ncbi:MAG: hypothetical protein LUD50_04680 [Clostridia bacterium]|nr:hypothetical protein [Clostridia bacterium]
MEGMTLEKLQVIIQAQTSDYYNELSKVKTQTQNTASVVETQTTKMKNAFSKIAGVIGVALSVTKLISFGKECIELGSNLTEVQNVVDVTFGDLSSQINTFARNAIEQFGLSETSAKQYASTLGAIFKSAGFTVQEAADMSTELTGLAADMASFYNLDTEEAFNKIRSGITGQVQGLQELGISLTEANLEEFRISQGITTAYSAMSQQDKELLRYQYLLSVTSDAQGDFARSSDSWANQVRVLTERFNSLKTVIGQGLIKVFTPIIKTLNNLLSVILTVTDAFSNLMSKLTGSAKTTTTAVAATSSAAEDLSDSVEDVGTSASGAAKELAGLGSFDEIHSLTDSGGSGSGSGSGGSGSGSGIEETVEEAAEETSDSLNPALEALIERLQELRDLFKEGFLAGLGDVNLDSLNASVKSIKESLMDIWEDPEVQAAANEYANAVAYSLGQVAGSVASIGITIATNVVGGISKYLGQNTARIKQYIVDMFDINADIATIRGNFAEAIANIFSAFGGENGQQATANLIGIFADAFMGVSELAGSFGRDLMGMITQPFVDNQGTFKETLDTTLGLISENLGMIKQAVDDTLGKAQSVYDEHLAPLFDSLGNGLSEITGTLLDAYNTYIVPVLEGLQDKWQKLYDEHLKPTMEAAMDLIGQVADAVSDIWNQVLVPFIEWFIENVAPVIADAMDKIGTVVSFVWGLVSDIITGVLNALGGLINFIAGVFTGDWERAWSGIQTFFSTIWNTILSVVQTVWSAIQTVVSTVVNTISGIISSVFNGIKTVISTVMNTVKTTISTALNSIKTTWNNIWNALSTTVSNIFNGIWSTIKGVINSILGGIESMANGVINGINTIINALNNLSFDIPDWVPALGGKHFGFSINTLSTVSLPRLAEGGIIDSPTVAMIGESGQEAVLPLENNTEWIDQLAARIGEVVGAYVQIMADNDSQGNEYVPITAEFDVDGRTIFKATKKYELRRGYDMTGGGA